MKAKIIVLDTNVYGWYLAYRLKNSKEKSAINSYNLISKLLQSKDIAVHATEQIEKEVKKAKDPELKSLFYALVRGIIKKNKKIVKLAREYFKISRKEELHKVTVEDCEIIASCVVAGIKLFVTENRESINNSLVKKIFDEVNSRWNLKSPKIVDSGEAVHELVI
jgi:hypothetical protein